MLGYGVEPAIQLAQDHREGKTFPAPKHLQPLVEDKSPENPSDCSKIVEEEVLPDSIKEIQKMNT